MREEMNTETLRSKRKQHLVKRMSGAGKKTTDLAGEIIELYTKGIDIEELIIGEASFWAFVNMNYSLSHIFLPSYPPKNNKISFDEVIELKKLMVKKEHYEIRNIIRKKYLR